MSLVRNVCQAAFAVLSIIISPALFGTGLTPANAIIGENLQAGGIIRLSDAAPEGGLQLTLTSNDPKRLLLSKTQNGNGEQALTLTVQKGSNASPEFYLYALDHSGTATYSITAPGCTSVNGTVTMARSALVVATSRVGLPLMTIAGSKPTTVNIYPTVLDETGSVVEVQPVRGGWNVMAQVTSSNPQVGRISTSTITLEGSAHEAKTQFEALNPGETNIAVNVPAGFSAPAKFSSVTATVRTPAIGLNNVTIGKDLQLHCSVSIGRAAPEQGLQITLTSDDPSQLILSEKATVVGSKSITITVPAGSNTAAYYLQALGSSGTITYTASAPGFQNGKGEVTLTPSGMLLGMTGPPDEAELFRKEAADHPHGFVTTRSSEYPVQVFTAQLNPVHHRAADITVQPLRAGVTATIELKSDNPLVGTVTSPVTIHSGESTASVKFVGLTAGSTGITLTTPPGFTKAGNATFVTAIVKD